MDSASKRYCSVPMCHTYKTEAVTLHRFPPDAVLREKWREILMIQKPVSKFMCVCSKHFKIEDYSRATANPKMRRLLHGVVPSLNLPDDDVTIEVGKLERVKIMSSHHLPSTSQSSAPPTKKVKRGEIAVKATNAKAQRKGNSSTPSSANSGTLVVKTEATREENSPQCSGTQTFDEVVIKKEINDTSSENDTVSQIKGAKEDKRSVGSKANEETENSGNFSFLPILTKTEIKSESEDNEEPAEVQDLDVKEEEFIIKEESDEEDWETRSTSNASTQTDDNEDERTAMNEEVERLLAQLGPKKKTIKGQKAQFTDNDVLQFTITLLRGKGAPRIWRRFQVPATYTFREFHIAIQKAMGWKSVQFDYHLHAFRMINPSTGYEDTIVMREDVGFYDNSKDENVTKIKDYCTIVNHKGKYEYDFGISWQHEYVFEGSSPRVEGKTYPVCLEGEKACPPEDGVESDEDYDSDAFDAEACF